ncbi:MAG: hypothetical protein NT034_02620 [Candidatus Magasanikbacteria bacterium]|nr:hypothetical protein [Candidatus Magasanikbacteria bacterium]
MKKFFLVTILVFTLLAGSDAKAFSISPLKISASIAATDNKDWEIKIKNNSNQISAFYPVVIGMKQDDVGRSIFGKNIDVAENWFKINKEEINLGPGETASIIFSVNVPANTPPGAHYLGLAVQEKNGQSLSTQLATVLNLQISGTAKEALELEKLSLNKNIFFDKKWSAQMQVRNTGNVSLNLGGEENLFYFGKKISSRAIGLGNALFAQSTRNINIILSDSDKIMLPGLYRTNIGVVYGLTHQTLNADLNFWYLPYWFLGVFGIFILLVIFFVFKKNKNEMV